MSKIVATLAIQGAQELYKQASDFLNKAIKEKGENQKIGFPETAFYLPMANALLGAKVETLKDALPILEHAKSLLSEPPSEKVWLPYLGNTLDSGMAALFCEEIITALRYLYGTDPEKDCVGFCSDSILRQLGIQLVDNILVQPTVVARSVEMHPLVVLFVVMVGSQLMGIVGMIIAVPLFGILKVSAQTKIGRASCRERV